MKKYCSFFLIASIILTSCDSNKNVCVFFQNESKIKVKSVDDICDSLTALKKGDKLLFIHLSNERLGQKDRMVISKNIFSKEKLDKCAAVFFYKDSDLFDIVFSDSLKTAQFLINRMNFVSSFKTDRNSRISSYFFFSIINEFKKIDSELP